MAAVEAASKVWKSNIKTVAALCAATVFMLLALQLAPICVSGPIKLRLKRHRGNETDLVAISSDPAAGRIITSSAAERQQIPLRDFLDLL